MTKPIYLDYNASAPVKPMVARVFARALEDIGNPSSVHGYGRKARKAIEDARARVAALLDVDPERVIFTSGGTEANNLALAGCGRRHFLLSAVEHASVLEAARRRDGRTVSLPVDADGLVDLDRLEAALAGAGEPALVSVMLANNETGVVQPVARAAEIARKHGALFHCDAVQAPGRIPLDLRALGADYVSLSAHKFGGPKGVGALVLGARVLGARAEPAPQLIGGGQERGRRAGTENLPGIVGFGVAAELTQGELESAPGLARLRDGLERRIGAAAPDARVFGAGVARLPNTSCLTMPGVRSETQVMAFDLDGVAVSAGAACSSGKVEASHVLGAMGVAEDETRCAIRVSLGWATVPEEVDRFVELWKALHRRLGACPDERVDARANGLSAA
ncbi:MAG: cysteine desulfurase family protein [Proteobacteria bacterium]|nr:cysteine desulfurase family protein [Pseudomonadota bacterium]